MYVTGLVLSKGVSPTPIDHYRATPTRCGSSQYCPAGHVILLTTGVRVITRIVVPGPGAHWLGLLETNARPTISNHRRYWSRRGAGHVWNVITRSKYGVKADSMLRPYTPTIEPCWVAAVAFTVTSTDKITANQL